ncbi:MAG TPA: hypothetical protein VF077_00395 [Nitrospiraceae bacterium]
MAQVVTFLVAQPTSHEACQMIFALAPFLRDAIDESHGEMDLQDLFGLVFVDRAKVWLVFEKDSQKLRGVAVTEEVEYPKHTNLRVTFLGGTGIEEWKQELDCEFCGFCEVAKLANIEVVGRRGFARVLEPLAYVQAYTVLIKEVCHG